LGCGEPSRVRKWKSQADGTSSDAEIDRALYTEFFSELAAFNGP